MVFSPAPEYQVFPTRERPLKPYEAAVRAAMTTREFVRAFAPDVVVSDILTPAPALAGRARGRAGGDASSRTSTRISRPGFPPFSIGARLPRTRVGARSVAVDRPRGGHRAGAGADASTTTARARLGLAPLP